MAGRALREQWSDDLEGMFRAVARPRSVTPSPSDPADLSGAPSAENGATPTIDKRSELNRNDVEATIETAGELFRSAMANVHEAEARLAAAERSSRDQIDARQREVAALEERLAAATNQFDTLLEEEGQKILAAQAEAEAAADLARSWEERAAQVEAEAERSTGEFAATLKDVRQKLFAAETRAQEAADDLEYLREMTVRNFSLDPSEEAAKAV